MSTGPLSFFERLFTWNWRPRDGNQTDGPIGTTAAKVVVNDERAMMVSAYFRCARLISELVGSLPIRFYEIQPNGSRVELRDYPLWHILEHKPNAYQTACEYRESRTLFLCTWGNTYSVITRNGVGDVMNLEPLYSGAMDVEKQPGEPLVYRYNDNRGQIEYTDRQIFHVKLFGPSPYVGLSPMQYAKETLGLAVAVEDSANKLFANGMRPSGVLQASTPLKPDQRENLRKYLDLKFSGSGNWHLPLVLEGGMTWTAADGMSPEDAQMLQTRNLSAVQICQFFGVPPEIIGISNGSNAWAGTLEALNRFLLTYTLRPYLIKWEQRIRAQLMPARDQRRIICEFDTDDLMRADMKSMGEYMSQLVNNGVATRNEARGKLRMQPAADQNASALTVQSAMVPIASIGNTLPRVPAASPAGAAPPAPAAAPAQPGTQ